MMNESDKKQKVNRNGGKSGRRSKRKVRSLIKKEKRMDDNLQKSSWKKIGKSDRDI